MGGEGRGGEGGGEGGGGGGGGGSGPGARITTAKMQLDVSTLGEVARVGMHKILT